MDEIRSDEVVQILRTIRSLLTVIMVVLWLVTGATLVGIYMVAQDDSGPTLGLGLLLM